MSDSDPNRIKDRSVISGSKKHYCGLPVFENWGGIEALGSGEDSCHQAEKLVVAGVMLNKADGTTAPMQFLLHLALAYDRYCT